MVDALRVISVERGIDPREFTLVAFGGAGALHAAEIAAVVGIRQVLVPPYPGNTSAYGLLTAGLRTDLSTTLLVRADDPDALARLNEALVPCRSARSPRFAARASRASRRSSSTSRCASSARTTTAKSRSRRMRR